MRFLRQIIDRFRNESKPSQRDEIQIIDGKIIYPSSSDKYSPPEEEFLEEDLPDEIEIHDGEIASGFDSHLVLKREGITIYSHSSADSEETPTIERLSEEAIGIEIEKLAQMMDSNEGEIEFESLDEEDEGEEDIPEVPQTKTHIIESAAPKVSPEIPCYLKQDSSDDFDNFLTYLETSGKSQRTVAEYGRNLKTWKRMLSHEMTAEAILDQLTSLSYHKAVRMKAVLNAYADYRHSIGDAELKILLALNPFTPPKPEEVQQNGLLSEKEIQIYWTTAKELCQEGDRVGIWIGLSLLGARPSEIKELKMLNKSTIRVKRRKNDLSIKCPLWLITAMKDIHDWRQGRKTIYTGVSQYEATPTLLNSAAHNSSKLDKLQSVSKQ